MPNYKDWEKFADGSSGDIELEKAWLRQVADIFDVFRLKQRSYGPMNIAKFGELGVMVRTSDKLERLVNLIMNNLDNPLADESLDDTWIDLADYGIIAMLCRKGAWPHLDTGE